MQFVRTVFESAEVSDTVLRALLQEKYEGIPYRAWIALILAGAEAYRLIREGRRVEAARLLAETQLNFALSQFADALGGSSVFAIAQLGVLPIKVSLNKFIKVVDDLGLRVQIDCYFKARALRPIGETHESILQKRSLSGEVFFSDEGWLFAVGGERCGRVGVVHPIQLNVRQTLEVARWLWDIGESRRDFLRQRESILRAIKASDRFRQAATPPPPSPTPLPQVSAAISPPSGPAGTSFTVTWSGFTPNATLTSHLRRPDGTEFSPRQFGTDAAGRATGTINSAGFAPGRYTHWAVDDRTGRRTAEVTFEVTTAATPPPPSPTPAGTLDVTLTASPASGAAPLRTTLTARVGGTATGTINYTFYCHRADPGTNITQPWSWKFDGVNVTQWVVPDGCTYSSPGTYAAKVIAERGTRAAEARVTITVTAAATPQPTPTLRIGEGAPNPAVFVDAYNRNGGVATLGAPTGPARRWGAGWVQDFVGGTRGNSIITHADGSGTAYVVTGTILQRYRAIGGPTHFIGFPTSDEAGPGPPSSRTGRTARYQVFARGSLQWILQTNQVFIVQGDIYRLWASIGYQASCLGLPTSDEYRYGAGSRSDFEGGHITWTPTEGSRHTCQ